MLENPVGLFEYELPSRRPSSQKPQHIPKLNRGILYYEKLSRVIPKSHLQFVFIIAAGITARNCPLPSLTEKFATLMRKSYKISI